MVYILYLLLIGIQGWYADRKGWLSDEKGKAGLLMVSAAELILLATVRGRTVGADTEVYLNIFRQFAALPKSQVLTAPALPGYDFEWGYSLLMRLCALIDLPETFFLGIIAIIIYIPVFCSIYRYSKLPYISILAYFATEQFAYSLGIFRQMIALSIILCGLRFVEEKKLWKYALVVVGAMMFHTTAVVAILLYFVYQFPIGKYAKWILPAELFLSIMGRPIFWILVKIFPKYSGYVNSRFDLQGGSYLGLILLNILLFVLLYLQEKKLSDNRLPVAALTVAVLMQPVAYSMALLGRTVTYFSYFQIFAFSEIAYVLLNKQEVFSVAKADFLRAKDCCFDFAKKYHLTVEKVIWILFLGGLFGLAVLGLVGNPYVTPYKFWFMN